MRKELEQFNTKHVGTDNVFPIKNGAPKILEHFKDKPYSLELRDEFTTGNKPKSLPTIKANNVLSWQTCHMQSDGTPCAHHPSGVKMR
jgi:hypothetical protein